MKMKKTNSDLFTATFIGEHVEILATYETSEKMPLVIHGYLLDLDDDYYFIGDNPLEIRSVVKKEDVTFIEITEAVDPTIEMLEGMPIPEGENETN